MPLPPTSARGPALNYVELRPTLVFESHGKVSGQDKTEKLYQRRPNKDEFEKRFDGHSERVRRGLVEKRHKEQEAARDAANQKLEEGFSLNWSTTSKARVKSKAEPKQLPLFAAKLHSELLEDEAREFEGQPLASILGCEARQDGAAVPHNFMVGDEVEVRDKDMVEWRAGVVTSETPLKVTLDDWDHAFQWDFVRRPSKPKEPPDPPQSLPPMPPVVQPEKHCVCGYKFLQDAVFCSRCGRQRGCEIPKSHQQPRDAPRPPRPPGGPIARKPKRNSLPEQPAAHPPSSGRLGSPSPRRQSAEMTRRPSLGNISKGSHHAGEGARLGASRADSPHEAFQVEVYEEFQKSASPLLPPEPKPRVSKSSRADSPHEAFHVEVHEEFQKSPSPLLPAEPKPRVSKWQQLTVPILADNGEVVALKPAASSQQSAWQQHTVPILGEDGQVVALRPAMGSSPMPEWKQTALPIFNEQGELVALPSGRSAWQQNTVPILGQDGEVIALRPDAGKAAGWKQVAVPVFNTTGEVVAVHPPIGNLKQWEQLTVPILAEDGKVLGLRPCGEQYEMPAWESPATARGSRPTASVGSSIVSDRTWLPPPPKSARSSRAVSEAGADATLRPARSGRWAQESCSEAESVNSCGKPKRSSWPDDTPVPAVSKEEDVPRPLSLPGSRCSTPESSAGDAASCASFQHILRSASADSLASIDRILNMANAARQATPDGQMMQVLRDALCSETSGSSAGPSGHFQLPQAPEADELVARLRQLPELWRGTILQMLEQAEAVQLASKDFPK